MARVDGVEPSNSWVKVNCLSHLAIPSLAPEVGIEPTTFFLTGRRYIPAELFGIMADA